MAVVSGRYSIPAENIWPADYIETINHCLTPELLSRYSMTDLQTSLKRLSGPPLDTASTPLTPVAVSRPLPVKNQSTTLPAPVEIQQNSLSSNVTAKPTLESGSALVKEETIVSGAESISEFANFADFKVSELSPLPIELTNDQLSPANIFGSPDELYSDSISEEVFEDLQTSPLCADLSLIENKEDSPQQESSRNASNDSNDQEIVDENGDFGEFMEATSK